MVINAIGILKFKTMTKLEKLKNKQRRVQQEYTFYKKEAESKKAELGEINKEINKITNDTVEITDHALIRYFERVLGILVNDFKDSLLTDKIVSDVSTLGGTCKIDTGEYTLVFVNHKCVTITRK